MSLLNVLTYITWDLDPDIFTIPIINHPVRWYGLFFALAFLISQQIMYFIYKKEGRPVKEVDTLTIYMVVATIVGARLGHVLFYDPIHYFQNPHKIIMVWCYQFNFTFQVTHQFKFRRSTHLKVVAWDIILALRAVYGIITTGTWTTMDSRQ